LNESQPVFDFLAPAHPQAASFGKPAEGAFHHPAACRIESFTWHRTCFKERLAPAAAVFDVGDVTGLFDKVMHIRIVIASIHTKVLFHSGWFRAWHHNRDNQVIGNPFVMTVGSCNVHRQGRAPLVHQQVDFAPVFTPIRRVSAGCWTAQRGRAALAIKCLPLPLDGALSGIEPDHDLHYPGENPIALPALKAFMQRTATDPKPVFMHRFPLAPCPQHIPDAVQDRAIVRGWSARTPLFRRLWKQLSDLTPQWSRHMEVVDIFRLWGSILAQGTSRFRWVGRTPILSEMCSFFTPQSFYG